MLLKELKKVKQNENIKAVIGSGVKIQRQLSINESMMKKQCWDIHDTRSKIIHKAIGEMICIDNEPYNVVERTGFKKLMEVVKPQYKVSLVK